MKKLIVCSMLLGMALSVPVYGADDKPEDSLWERLRKKIELITPKKKITATTAVGGVRGAQADAEDVYWKGEANAQSVETEELQAFKKALSLAESGNVAGAQAAFSDFLKQYPNSRLRPDAEEALALLRPKK